MNPTEYEMERKADDAWTGMRLVTLAVVTLGAALTVIYLLASSAAPY